MNNDYRSLLGLIGQLVENENKIQAERAERGEKYNVFNVLGLWSEEVRLHSAFLANLLNPKANHGLKEAFLNAFIEQMNLTELKLSTYRCEVYVERHIGQKNEDSTEGGRIDIIIEDTQLSKAVIIENKIYACDQPKQLLRYNNYATKHYPGGFQIIYLTLYGDEPKSKQDNIKLASYRDDIRDWLGRCIELSAQQPLVRETVSQYQTLVKQLTNQTMENSTTKKIADLLAQPENLEKAVAIFDSAVQIQWREKALEALRQNLESWAEENREIHFDTYGPLGCKESGYCFYRNEWNTMAIFVYTETNYFRDFYFGISSRQNGIHDGQPKIHLNSLSEAPTDCWPFGWQRLSVEYKDWTNEVFADMLRPDSKLANHITNKVDEIMRELEERHIELY